MLTVAHVSYIACQFILVYVKDQAQEALGFSDAQYGLLVGYAFSLVFVVAGIPIGYVSDVHSRKVVIVASISLWSVATVAQGAAPSFALLLLARMLQGVGSAGFNAASFALIADYFAASQRSVANSVFSTSVYMGGGITAALGSLLADSSFGWRWTVAAFGFAGIGIALAVATTRAEVTVE
ncbi:major facilitator superfamily transporter MFS_1 [Thecamonas trahens ATCC 50062]|uniref:Major facilitator superfamily transporter MFS_1 n=1 Tax=Thecamonas trahens ATCC 50062 TaxID=461836 RepID=A0A0L0DK83_THETB|nr:major facilitator superfamily transporter MFS_1 [Thecamonas trahens ATCC 50062]KNC52819.1 major facilitator superfamily transporter MFS_1 [Thecamonas trahens ATCC 50062]|eukprot:XP_013754925.1 major facilitator superfamily transporter MFS_1 [Thecamonas trahens ATCC 50062]